ncbi:hypothetical protein FACS1894176_00110 [Bacteroidia bacterium]|nr:hypothetical protein FACS1894176_00110 [Bacteroidia bacterium]
MQAQRSLRTVTISFRMQAQRGLRTVMAGFCCLAVIGLFSCEEKQYEINQDFYRGKTLAVKNVMSHDTLRVELTAKDVITLAVPEDSTVVFDNRSFIFTVEDETIISIAEDGEVIPYRKGITKVNVLSRAAAHLTASFYIEVYKEYQAVENIWMPADVVKIIEVDEPYNFSGTIIAFPANADNKQLHFSMAENSKQYAEITDDGIITGKLSSGRNRATIQIVSDDNPDVTATIEVQVVTEVVISDVTLLKALNGLNIGEGAKVDLNLCTGVLPANVNVKNRNLTFEVRTGQEVVSVDATGMMTAIGEGTATVRAISKNNRYKDFTIVVKNGLTDLTRVLWTVKTSVSYGFAPDNATGMPEDMFDANTGTFFSVVKPNKSYNGNATPADHIPSFTVDMKSVQKFNYLFWQHRSGNSYAFLRVWGIDIEGSNDGENFTTIKNEIEIPHADNTTKNIIAIPESEYRYVKVYLTKWSDNSGGETGGNTMQTSEFGLGYK